MSDNIKIQAEIFQEECQKTVEDIIGLYPNIQYDSAINVWMFTKLAELQIQINELRYQQNINKPFGL